MPRRSNAFGSWLSRVAGSALSFVPSLFRKAGPVVIVSAALVLGLAAVTGIASDLLLAAKDHATALRIGGTVAIAEAEAELVEAEARNIRADAAISQSEALAADARVQEVQHKAQEVAILSPLPMDRRRGWVKIRLIERKFQSLSSEYFQDGIDVETARRSLAHSVRAILERYSGSDDITQSEMLSALDSGDLRNAFTKHGIVDNQEKRREIAYVALLLSDLSIRLSE